MKLTSNEINKLIKQFREELNRLTTVERLSYSFKVSTNEDVEKVRPEYDMVETMCAIASVQRKIVSLKHSLNKFNVETKLPCGLTIDQALVTLPMLTSEQSKYAHMKNKVAKQRCSTWNNNNVEYEIANYDIIKAIELYQDITARIETIQKELDVVNNTITIEVEDI